MRPNYQPESYVPLSSPFGIFLAHRISILSMHLQAEWKTVLILIRWFLRSQLIWIWIYTVFLTGNIRVEHGKGSDLIAMRIIRSSKHIERSRISIRLHKNCIIISIKVYCYNVLKFNLQSALYYFKITINMLRANAACNQYLAERLHAVHVSFWPRTRCRLISGIKKQYLRGLIELISKNTVYYRPCIYRDKYLFTDKSQAVIKLICLIYNCLAFYHCAGLTNRALVIYIVTKYMPLV